MFIVSTGDCLIAKYSRDKSERLPEEKKKQNLSVNWVGGGGQRMTGTKLTQFN